MMDPGSPDRLEPRDRASLIRAGPAIVSADQAPQM